MCGICGLVISGGSDPEIVGRSVRAMADRIAHRGPDDQGVQVLGAGGGGPVIGLGHRRLSIIDLSPAGHQPMQSPSGQDVWIVFNGEIYNFLELRPELEARGVRFRSGTDTEVILAAYELWGTACVERFNGMFAFAIWDARLGRLFLARDRLGKKPLAYWAAGGLFAFASELSALTVLPDLPRDLDEQGLAAYFSLGFLPGDRAIISAVRKLLPAHAATWRDGRFETWRYWNPVDAAARPSCADANEAHLLEELDHLLRDATRKRLISDVPLGAWLSGGVDSTLVVAEMREATRGVRTFTIGFGGTERDESERAREVARYLGTQHEEFHVTPRELLAVVPEAAGVYDEPFSDEAGIPTYVVSKLSRQHVTVALCGDGGDEGFMGYSHYLRGRLLAGVERVPAWLRRSVAQVGGLVGGQAWRQRMRSLAFEDWADFYVRMTSTLRPETAGRVMAAPFVLDGTVYRELSRQVGDFEPELKMSLFDTMTTLPDKFLVKVDRASMRVALEVRAPFLDYRIIEWALSIPRRHKIRGGVTKHLLRELLYRKVPRHLVDRPKMGFCPPIEQWLRRELADWARDVLAPRRVRETGVLDERAVTRIVDLHLSGRAEFGPALWTLICFMVWHDRVGRTAAIRSPVSAAGRG